MRLTQAAVVDLVIASVLSTLGAAAALDSEEPPATTCARQPNGLRVGGAVDVNQLRNNATYREVLAREFKSVTAENAMKWQTLEPQGGVFNFMPATTPA